MARNKETSQEDTVYYDGMLVTRNEALSMMLGDSMDASVGWDMPAPRPQSERETKWRFDDEAAYSMGFPLLHALSGDEE